MNEIIEDYYLKYIECLSTKDKKICDNLFLFFTENKKQTKNPVFSLTSLNNIPPLSPKKPLTISKEKQAWKYDINRGNFKKK